MTNTPRDSSGRFLYKSGSPRFTHSIQFTNDSWSLITKIAQSKNMSVSDYLDSIFNNDLTQLKNESLSTLKVGRQSSIYKKSSKVLNHFINSLF